MSTTVTATCGLSWEEGMRSRLQVRDFTPMVADEPAALGGTDKGPNPIEYLMGSLSSCVSVMIGIVGVELGFKHAGVALDAAGDLDVRGLMGDPQAGRHFTGVRLEVRLSTDESAERLAQLQQKVEARCPMVDLFRAAGVPVTSTWSRA